MLKVHVKRPKQGSWPLEQSTHGWCGTSPKVKSTLRIAPMHRDISCTISTLFLGMMNCSNCLVFPRKCCLKYVIPVGPWPPLQEPYLPKRFPLQELREINTPLCLDKCARNPVW